MTKLPKTSLILSLSLAAALFAGMSANAGVAAADPVAHHDRGFGKVQRSGFIIGFSLGTGSFGQADCETCETFDGTAVDIHLGGMLTPRLALMFDGSGVGSSVGNGTLVNVVDTIAAQYWLSPRFWIKGGLGVGRLAMTNADGEETDARESGSAGMLAVGVEVVQTRGFAMDLQLRGSAATYDNNDTVSMGTLSLGFNWY